MQVLNNNRGQKPEARGQNLELDRAFGSGAIACVRMAFLVSGFWLLPSTAHAQDGQTLVAQMKSAEATVSYSATQASNGGTARIFRSGLKRRLEWQSPTVKSGDILVDDGTNVYLYHRAEKSATKTNSRGRVPSFVAMGTPKATTLAGRRAFLVPVSGNRTLTIDAQTKTLLAVTGGNGGFSLSGIKFGAVPASKFDFEPPAGVKVNTFDGTLYANLNAASRAASWLKTLAQPPAGWSFESAIVGTNSAWLRYSNGQNRISLFEQPTADGDYKPQPVNGGGGTFWRKGGVRFLATGSPPSALQNVVDQLK
ncbi:hypothetical protein IAD21_01736 [Abditibacteriota bacterium]|nr:hypothetical protein IAD21_01736 [Abditibacteriota bacterium]